MYLYYPIFIQIDNLSKQDSPGKRFKSSRAWPPAKEGVISPQIRQLGDRAGPYHPCDPVVAAGALGLIVIQGSWAAPVSPNTIQAEHLPGFSQQLPLSKHDPSYEILRVPREKSWVRRNLRVSNKWPQKKRKNQEPRATCFFSE